MSARFVCLFALVLGVCAGCADDAQTDPADDSDSGPPVCDEAQPASPCDDLSDVLTVEAFVAQRETLAGPVVRVRGVLEVGLRTCSGMACTADNPCCNGCVADLELVGADLEYIRPRAGANALSCSGNDCGVCCSLDVSGDEVVVVGQLERETSMSTGETLYFGLTEAIVCAP